MAHHDRKADAEDVFDTVSGTLGLIGGVGAIAVIKRSTQGTTLHIEGRDLSDTVEKAVRFDRETCRWVILGEAVEVHRSETKSAILAVLVTAPHEGMSNQEIMDAAALKDRNLLDQTHRRMQLAGEIDHVKRGR